MLVNSTKSRWIKKTYRKWLPMLRMPITNSATFQHVMDTVLRRLQNEFCLLYVDYIIITSASFYEHLLHLTIVFQRLKETNFKIQLVRISMERYYIFRAYNDTRRCKTKSRKNCSYHQIPYFQNYKTKKISFRIISVLPKIIEDIVRLTKPLTLCMQKYAKIQHTPKFVKCFEDFKNVLMEELILHYSDFKKILHFNDRQKQRNGTVTNL